VYKKDELGKRRMIKQIILNKANQVYNDIFFFVIYFIAI